MAVVKNSEFGTASVAAADKVMGQASGANKRFTASDIAALGRGKRVVGNSLIVMPPATLFAQYSGRAGGSTPAEQFPVWNFDKNTDWFLDVFGTLANWYPGAGLKVEFDFLALTATTGNCVWNAAFRRLDTGEDLDASHAYSPQAATVATAGTAGVRAHVQISFANTDIDSLAAGEPFVLRISRDANNGSDTMDDVASLLPFTIQILEA